MKYFLEIIIFSLILVSCKSKNDEVLVHETTNNREDSIIVINDNIGLKQEIQSFKISPLREEKIIGKQGTVIVFSAGCFGDVQRDLKIELIECYSIQDMIINRLSTQTSEGKLLESDGMIRILALNNEGDTLNIEKSKVAIEMPTKLKKKDIQLFEGVETKKIVEWCLSKDKINIESPTLHFVDNNSNIEDFNCCGDSIAVKKSEINIDKSISNKNLINYVFQVSKMGWINCDRYIEGETAPLLVKIPKESSGASYYLILKNYNSSVPPKTTNDGKLSFMVPVNEPFTIVAIGTSGKDTYFNMVDYSGGQNEVTFSELKPVTRQELIDLLLKKFGKDIWNRPLA